MQKNTVALLFCLSMAPNGFSAETIETDWLKAKVGEAGEAINAQVVNVETQGNRVAVDVALPVERLEEYETVIVIGKQPKQSKKHITLVKTPQWLHDDENEPYGLRFYVEGVPGFEFRIQLRAAENKP